MSSEGGPAEEHEEHGNHEAWVIPYADLLTLLMAMFIALFAMSTVDQTKVQAVANGFKEAIGGKVKDSVFSGQKSGSAAIDGNGQGPSLQDGGSSSNPTADSVSQAQLQAILKSQTRLTAAQHAQLESLQGVENAIVTAAKSHGVGDKISLELQNRGLVVRIVTDQVLFDSGSAVIKPEGRDIVAIVGAALQRLDNIVIVEGHTDNVPLSNSPYMSNWGLSGARAGAVADVLIALGIDPQRVETHGYADTRPIATNATAQGRALNRRVDIVVQSKVIQDLLNADRLDDTPAKPQPLGATPSLGVAPNVKPPVGLSR